MTIKSIRLQATYSMQTWQQLNHSFGIWSIWSSFIEWNRTDRLIKKVIKFCIYFFIKGLLLSLEKVPFLSTSTNLSHRRSPFAWVLLCMKFINCMICCSQWRISGKFWNFSLNQVLLGSLTIFLRDRLVIHAMIEWVNQQSSCHYQIDFQE